MLSEEFLNSTRAELAKTTYVTNPKGRSKEASEANTTFTRLMTEKINAVLDVRGVSLASELYNKTEITKVK